MAIRRIGQVLVDLGFMSDTQLEALLEEQEQRPGELLGKIGMVIVVRVLGLILCAMAVQFVIVGVGEATHNLVRAAAATPYPATP